MDIDFECPGWMKMENSKGTIFFSRPLPILGRGRLIGRDRLQTKAEFGRFSGSRLYTIPQYGLGD
jgi:hypothetical protein